MIVAELLENAIKHGTWKSDVAPAFRLRVWSGGDRHAFVSVENPIKADSIAEVNRIIEFIRSHASADEAYRARLLEVAANPQAGVSGLGLVRVAYEGNCTLSCKASDDNTRITIIAETVLP
jgi:hypothetical protein